MLPYDLSLITATDIINFYKNNRVGESHFDYKRELGDLGSTTQKNEFLKDITSFANADGGDLIIGIDDKQDEVEGTTFMNDDVLLSQIDQITRDNISPRLPRNPDHRFIELGNGNKILILRVYKSHIGPHRIYKEGKDFWSRGVNGKFSLDVPQLRRLFLTQERTRDEISGFIASRTEKILSGNAPVQMASADPILILHLIAIPGFAEDVRLDFRVMRDNARTLVSLESDAPDNITINFDGLVKYNTFNNEIVSYSQVFYSGTVECVATKLIAQKLPTAEGETKPMFIATRFAKTLFKDLPEIFKYLDEIGFQYPLLMHLQLHNVQGVRFTKMWPPNPIAGLLQMRNPTLTFPEIVLQDHPEFIAKELRPWLDLIWRAFGFEGCPNYHPDGSYSEAPGPGHQGRIWK